MKTRINYRSFDFDGCIFNARYINSTSQNRLIEANEKLIQSIADDISLQGFNSVFFMVGSNRQSLKIDDVNKAGKGSCFPALKELCADFQRRISPHITCRVDPYLLADTYGKTAEGENFEKALQRDHDYNYSHWLFDDSKLTLLYAQIHKAATDNPDAEIIFDFYDDRYLRKDILKGLADFFTANKDLIPANVKLRFHHYEGNGVSDIASIQGEGLIDSKYHEHINLMIHSANLSFHGNMHNNNHVLSSLLSGTGIEEFKKQRLVKINNNEDEETYYSYQIPAVHYKMPDSRGNNAFFQPGRAKNDGLSSSDFKYILARKNQPLSKRHENVLDERDFNITIDGSDEDNVNKVYDTLVAIQHGHPWTLKSRFHFIGLGGIQLSTNFDSLLKKIDQDISLNPAINPGYMKLMKDFYRHPDPDIVFIIPTDSNDLQAKMNEYNTKRKDPSKPITFYCACIEGYNHLDNIRGTAREKNIHILELKPTDLFVNPNPNGELMTEPARHFTNNIMGKGMRIAWDTMFQNIRNLKASAETQPSPSQTH